MVNHPLIYTNKNCIGCNKCIKTCPVLGANIACEEHGVSRIEVDGARCIVCGSCLDTCVHNAREYEDDTERFFRSLSEGRRITLLLAPAFKANYPDEYETVLGGLKELGVNRIISVSFGADITTWAYLNYIMKYDFRGGISQPCPAVTTYITRFLPELMPKLFPVQSPLMCAAIYARKELGITDEFAFISPCIAKKKEIEDPVNKGLVHYNVTFRHLMEYVRQKGIKGSPAASEIEYGMGSYYPVPGGLAETVRWFLGDEVFIRRMEGEIHLYRYLEAQKEQIRKEETPFLLFDVLNCKDGCICGTAVDPVKSRTDEALYEALRIREDAKRGEPGSPWSKEDTCEERFKRYNEQFAMLNLEDYVRTYADLSRECPYRIPNEEQLEDIFLSMRKDTEESRKINCSCCGYDSCSMMAEAIFNGFNKKENCIYYDKKMMEFLDRKRRQDPLTGLLNKIAFSDRVKELLREKRENDIALFIFDFDNFKNVNDHYGHRTGDGVLKAFANILRETLGEHATIGRVGGDEFMAFLSTGATDENIADRCDLIEQRLKNLAVGEAVGFSCSIGVIIDRPGRDFDFLYQHADDALYVAKAKGKACFVKWQSHDIDPQDKKVIFIITENRDLYPMIQETYGDGYRYVEIKDAERALGEISFYQDYVQTVLIDYEKATLSREVLQEYITSRPIFQEVSVLDIREVVDESEENRQDKPS